jgi:hypothetical protein
VAIAAIALGVSLRGAPAGEQATQLIADARQALGGDARLASIHSFTVKGSITFGSGASTNYGSFEIYCELPDRFVRRETRMYRGTPSGAAVGIDGTATTRYYAHPEVFVLGFAGDRIVYQPRWTQLDLATNSNFWLIRTPARPFLLQARQDFLRVTLGMFATSFPGAPVQFVDPPAAPRSAAVAVVGDGINATLFFDQRTHLPAGIDEYVYTDFRDVNGVRVPFRIVRTRDAARAQSLGYPRALDVLEEWRVRQFRVNVAIDPKVFRTYPVAR